MDFDRGPYRMRNGCDAWVHEITSDNRLLGCCTQPITGGRVAYTWDAAGRSLGFSGSEYDLVASSAARF